MAHPAETAGERAGRAAALEDQAIEQRRRGGDELLIIAAESVAEWLANVPQFADSTGESRAAYLRSYLAAYAAAWREETTL